MGFSNKQKNEQAVRTRGRRKNAKVDMLSIFNESVLQTVLNDFIENKAFIMTVDGEEVYAALLLNACDIGGISKKSQRDEAKGSMIEMIHSGGIKTYLTEDFLADEQLVFVPDSETIDAMDEFGMLEQAQYFLCYVHEDGSITRTPIELSFHDIKQIHYNGGSILDISSVKAIAQVIEEDANFDADYEDETEEGSELDEDEDSSSGYEDEWDGDQPFDVGPDSQFDEDDESVDVPEDESDRPSEDEQQEEIDSTEQEDAADPDAADPDEAVEISAEQVKHAVTRRFYSDDLGLEVNSDPFDSHFMHDNMYVPFNVDRGEGWLNGYLNQMSQNANDMMAQLHQSNLFKLRDLYFKLMPMCCESIQRDLDLTDSNTQYGKMHAALVQVKISEKSNLDEKVAKKKETLEAVFNEKLKQIGDDAARNAQRQFKDRFGKQHEDELYSIETNLLNDIDQRFQITLHEIHSARRNEASKRLDYGINETLAQLSKTYEKMLADEKAKYEAFHQEMIQFVDDYRKDEITRINVLADELNHSEKVAIANKEFNERLKQMSMEFDIQRKAAEDSINEMKRHNERMLKETIAASDERVNKMKSENEKLELKLAELNKEYVSLDAKKDKEYKSRIEQANVDKDLWVKKYDELVLVHKRHNTIATSFMAVAVVAAILIGFIVGTFTYTKLINTTADTKAEVRSERLIEMPKSYTKTTDSIIFSDGIY